MKRAVLHQVALVSTVECSSDMKAMGNPNGIHLDPSPEQMTYPEPRRAIPAFSSLNCRGTTCFKLQREERNDAIVELLDIFLTRVLYFGASIGSSHFPSFVNNGDDNERSGQTSYFYGSPPARTNNPVIRDTQFLNQSASGHTLPLCWNFPGGRPSGYRAEKHSPSCGATFGGGKLVVRIEGFMSGSSSLPALFQPLPDCNCDAGWNIFSSTRIYFLQETADWSPCSVRLSLLGFTVDE